ncbi:thiolase family protein [Alsobacter sp. SYSU M60028]|uniref:Thiolase family protein n=1 Tax=Alsobacter ponti TaxID=2962936 RepID=A0ABT1LEV3_9HYPH|nr:thiolase family protein [Alsobacter ponti]MCP8938763.1 thiolase family protein [Alsobacter ponti]
MTRRELSGVVAVAGVGTTKFGRLPGYSAEDLGIEAMDLALADAGLGRGDVDGLIVSRIPDYQQFCEMTGLDPRYVQITPGQGRMSGSSIQMAALAIAAGQCDVCALVYGNNGRSAGSKYGGEADRYGGAGGSVWFPYGMTSPGAAHAMQFERHAHLYGTTSLHLAEIAVAFRNHAVLNPDAVMRQPITVEDHQNSRFIAEPLHLFDYCLINDGGVALILTSAERARDMAKPPVYIRGFAQASALADVYVPPEDFWRDPMRRVAEEVYAMAGVTRDDMSALMIYDNFTPTVLFSLEGFGFCKPGESGPFVAEGQLRLGGRFPTNTSGGHLSDSYMQGWALNVEAVRQLRGECGDRQVKDASHVQFMLGSPIVSSIIYGKDPR